MGEPAKPGNTTGKVVGETASSDVPAASANPSLTVPDSVGTVKEQALKNIDDWVESTGYNTGAMVFGSVWKAVVEVAMPGSVGELAATVIPVGKIVKGVEVGAKAIGGALKAEKVIVTAAKSANEVEKVAEEAAKLEKKAAAVKKAQKESGQVRRRDSYREKTKGANKRDRQDVEKAAREAGVDRRKFGDFIEDMKEAEGRGPSDNYTWSELLDLAIQFKDGGW